jgi:hypothetical protein
LFILAGRAYPVAMAVAQARERDAEVVRQCPRLDSLGGKPAAALAGRAGSYSTLQKDL